MNSLARGGRRKLGDLRGLCPCDPRIYRLRAKIGAKSNPLRPLGAIPRPQKVGEGIPPPEPISATEAALRLLPSRALSSVRSASQSIPALLLSLPPSSPAGWSTPRLVTPALP